MNKSRWVFLLWAFMTMAQLHAAEGKQSARGVKFLWKAVENAVGYEIALSKKPDIDPVLVSRKVSETTTTLKLLPGTYYYRVRGIHKFGENGPWSEVETVIVNLSPHSRLLVVNQSAFPKAIDPKDCYSLKGADAEFLVYEIKAGCVLQKK